MTAARDFTNEPLADLFAVLKEHIVPLEVGEVQLITSADLVDVVAELERRLVGLIGGDAAAVTERSDQLYLGGQ